MSKYEKKPLLIEENVPTRVKIASFILKVSTWAVIIASVAIVTLNMVGLLVPIGGLAFYGIVVGSTLLAGLPLGIHEYRNTMEQATDLIEEKKQVTKELNELIAKPVIADCSNNVKKNQSEKIFSHFSSNQVFCASAAAIGGSLITIGKEIKTYLLPATELTTPTLVGIIIPGIGLTLCLAYVYKKSEMIVTNWENKIIDDTDEVNRKIKQTLLDYSIFQKDNINILTQEINSNNLLNVNSPISLHSIV